MINIILLIILYLMIGFGVMEWLKQYMSGYDVKYYSYVVFLVVTVWPLILFMGICAGVEEYISIKNNNDGKEK
jgi:hypothetical protein